MYSFPQIGENDIIQEKIYVDDLSGFKYFFAVLPIEYLFHDDKINRGQSDKIYRN